MKRKRFPIIVIFLCTTIIGYAQETLRYPAIKQQIDSLIAMDKKAGQKLMAAKPGTRDSLNKEFRKITNANTLVLKQIFKKYGFPNYDMVGKPASDNFFLGVQHSDTDLKFQRAVLKKMKLAVQQKKADPGKFAFLTDRVNANSGKAQIYGTQVDYTADGSPFPKKLIDPEKVNERRKAVGLEPIEEYLDFIINSRKQQKP